MSKFFASTEADARRQAEVIPHDCGETAFPGATASVTGSHVENLHLELTGWCPRCHAKRTLSFKLPVAAPVVRTGASTVASPVMSEGLREARELYGPRTTKTCGSCRGKGQTYGVLGDYTAGWSECSGCHGSGTVTVVDD